jgi:hypothetical protein
MNKRMSRLVVSFALVLSLSVVALADTVRLKDGSVIRGQVIAFNNQQFTILVGAGSRGRRSQITLYMEDVESIEFDSAGSAALNNNEDTNSRPSAPTATTTRPSAQRPAPTQSTQPDIDDTTAASQPTNRPSSSQMAPVFDSRVRADNTANGWTNSGFVATKGQRIRISARGSVTLGGGRVSTPVGLTGAQDNGKLMPAYPTGSLIAVIGDDNDDFISIGARREFIAQRDGVVFLGINEGNLSDNTGAYDVVIEAEPPSRSR